MAIRDQREQQREAARRRRARSRPSTRAEPPTPTTSPLPSTAACTARTASWPAGSVLSTRGRTLTTTAPGTDEASVGTAAAHTPSTVRSCCATWSGAVRVSTSIGVRTPLRDAALDEAGQRVVGGPGRRLRRCSRLPEGQAECRQREERERQRADPGGDPAAAVGEPAPRRPEPAAPACVVEATAGAVEPGAGRREDHRQQGDGREHRGERHQHAAVRRRCAGTAPGSPRARAGRWRR